MRIVGLLSWYDEQPAWLAELVASMARAGVDHLVAVDGAYAAYPDATGSSGSEQAHVVISAAAGAGMGVTVHQSREPWAGNEIEKRTFLFAAGHLVARPETDWLWIVDGDEVVTHSDGLRAALEATDLDAATCTLWEGVSSGEHEWNTQPLRMMFRSQPSGIRVHGHHACYLTGDGTVLWDNWQPTNEVPALHLPGVRVRHRPGDRPAYRNRKRNDYYNRSKAMGLEKTLPERVTIDTSELKKFHRDIKRADKEIAKELTAELRDVARKVATEASALAPRRTGTLASNYRGGAAGAKAVIRNKVFYSRFIEFGFHPGGGSRNVAGQNPIGRAIERQEDQIVEGIGDAVERASEHMGWHR